MSFFKNLFGGDDKSKKEAPAPAPAPAKPKIKIDPETAKKLETEAVLEKLKGEIQKFDNDEKSYENQIDRLKRMYRQASEAGNQRQAKKFTAQIVKQTKFLAGIVARRKIVEDKKIQLEVSLQNVGLINVIQEANIHQKGYENINEKFDDIVAENAQQKAQQKELNERMRMLAEDSQEEEEAAEMKKQLDREIAAEKKRELAKGGGNVELNVQPKKAQVVYKQQDQVSKMMNLLG